MAEGVVLFLFLAVMSAVLIKFLGKREEALA